MVYVSLEDIIWLHTILAPSEAAATNRKIFFQMKDAATNQERPLFKKYFFQVVSSGF